MITKSQKYSYCLSLFIFSALYPDIISQIPGDQCILPPVTGPCKARIIKFYYDLTSKSCQTFIYGGCMGNANNFNTLAECNLACIGKACELAPDPGPCYALIPKYYYDSNAKICKKFNYGGCGGNPNKFDTLDDCTNSCDGISHKVCILQPDSGPCEAYVPSYYYNTTTKSCQTFIYGGCQGNANRFDSITECRKMCGIS